MAIIEAEPYPFDLEPGHAGLVIIDMQRDFLEPGGFGAVLGNDVSLLRRTIAPTRRLLEAARSAGLTIIHTREGPRPDGPDPGARRARARHHPRTLSSAGGAGGRQAGKGRFSRHRPRRDAEEPRHRSADRLRGHHRGLRQYHGARSERPRLRM